MGNDFGMQATLRRGCGSEEIYTSLAARARELADACADPADRLAPLCDALWSELAPRGLSWIGFYLVAPPSEAEARTADPGVATEMILVARRDKPACSPIGLQGVCGQGFLEERIRLVEDVGLLGAGYIACDPRDRSEIVVPIYRNGAPWGVLDADSHELACFGEADVRGLSAVLRSAGLLDRAPEVRADRLHDQQASL
jgi:putative methionine-R-sulfoxide reductase with GAF domain